MESKKGGEHGNMEEIKLEGKQEKQTPEPYKKLVKMMAHGCNLLGHYYNKKQKNIKIRIKMAIKKIKGIRKTKKIKQKK